MRDIISDEAYEAGEAALAGWPIADSDKLDAASEVLQAVGPLIVAAELRRLVAELDARREEMREEDNRTLRASGLGEGVSRLRARIAELEVDGDA